LRLRSLYGVRRLPLDVGRLLFDLLRLSFDVLDDHDARVGGLRLDDELVEPEQAHVRSVRGRSLPEPARASGERDNGSCEGAPAGAVACQPAHSVV
jgi:hypothetical protein